MTKTTRLLGVLIFAAFAAGCATTTDRTGFAELGLFAVCEPYGLTLDWAPADVPELSARTPGTIEPRIVFVPDLPATRDSLALDWIPADVPTLAAPRREVPADSPAQLPPELPPTRGAPWLPAARDVPNLPPPARSELPAGADAPRIDLLAPTRSIDLGARSGPAVDDLRACTPGLVLAPNLCRLPARALLREPARRNP